MAVPSNWMFAPGCYSWILLIFLSLWIGGCRSEEAEMLKVEVRGVALDPETDSPVLFLVDPRSDRGLPIWIGMNEARAIVLGMKGMTPPRPLTHDLMKRILDLVGARVERVVITDLREGTYYAVLVVRAGGKSWEVDSRPSDAVALAVKYDAPLYLSPEIVRQGLLVELGGTAAASLKEDYGFTVQDLSAALRRYFGVDEGVVVTEVVNGGPADRAGLKRGDVVVRVAGREVEGVAEVREMLRGRDCADVCRMEVLRGRRRLSLVVKFH